MLLDQGHRGWIIITVILFVIATVLYVPYAMYYPGGARGNSVPGLIYGVLGSALMLFAGLLSARKKAPTMRIGRASTWLKGHIWLGLLTVPLIAYHAAFSWGGWLEIALWIVFLTIIVSGIFGLFLQAAIPRIMTDRVPLETIYEQIPNICSVIQFEADTIAAQLCGPLQTDPPPAATPSRLNDAKIAVYQIQTDPPADKDIPRDQKLRKKKPSKPVDNCESLQQFYMEDVRPFLEIKYDSRSGMANRALAAGKFEQLKKRLPPESHESIDELAGFCDERRQLALQTRLHHWLHGWLFLHIPLSFALLILGVMHAVMSSYY